MVNDTRCMYIWVEAPGWVLLACGCWARKMKRKILERFSPMLTSVHVQSENIKKQSKIPNKYPYIQLLKVYEYVFQVRDIAEQTNNPTKAHFQSSPS